jgi:hypothetical protein
VKALGIAIAAALLIGGGSSVTALASGGGGGTACDGHIWVGTGNIAGMPAQGRPKGFRAGDASAVYIWHDCDGWHLRTTDPEEPGNPAHAYIGVVTTGGKFTVVNGFKLEKKTDKVTETSPSAFMFTFKTYHQKDGVDWRTTGTTLSFDITAAPGKSMDVVVGKAKGRPTSGQFTFVQVAGPGASNQSGSSNAAALHGSAQVGKQAARRVRGVAGAAGRHGTALDLVALNRRHI